MFLDFPVGMNISDMLLCCCILFLDYTKYCVWKSSDFKYFKQVFSVLKSVIPLHTFR